MLIQASTPRPIFDISKHPEYIHIHTLAKAGVSEGTVRLSGTIDPEFGKTNGVIIEPINHYPIEGEDGFKALEHILPFWRLFQRPEGWQEAVHDGAVVPSTSVEIVRYCTPGFGVITGILPENESVNPKNVKEAENESVNPKNVKEVQNGDW